MRARAALADVVISRSGAGTIAELTALGKAAVFRPPANTTRRLVACMHRSTVLRCL